MRVERVLMCAVVLASWAPCLAIADEPSPGLAELVAELASPDPVVRTYALVRLRHLEHDRSSAVYRVFARLDDPDLAVRIAAARTLIDIDHELPSSAILRALTHGSRMNQRLAARAIGLVPARTDAELPDEATTVALGALLDADDPWVRFEAARALGYFERTRAVFVRALGDVDAELGSSAVVALANQLEDSFAQVSMEMLDEIAELIEPPTAPPADEVPEWRRPPPPSPTEQIAGAAWSARVERVLLAALSDPERIVRRLAVELLSRLSGRGEAVVVGLVAALRDPYPGTRAAAARGLVRVGRHHAIAVPALIAALGDPDGGTAGRVAFALGELGPHAHAAVPALVRVLATKDDASIPNQAYRCGHAARTLGRLGPGVAAPAVSALIGLWPFPAGESDRGIVDDVDPEVLAAEALASIGPKAIEALLAVLDRERSRPHVRALALRALGEIGPAASRAVSAVVHCLDDVDLEVRAAAVRALAAFGDAVVPAIPRLVRELGAASLSAGDAGRILLRFGDRALPALIAGLSDADATTRVHAAVILGQLGLVAEPAIPALVHALGDELEVGEVAATALGVLGARAIPALVRAVRAPGVARARAIATLGRIAVPDPDAIAALVALLGEPSDDADPASALASMGEPAIDPVTALVSSATASGAAKRSAIAALESLARVYPAAAQGLTKGYEDPDPEVVEAAVSAVAAIELAALPSLAEAYARGGASRVGALRSAVSSDVLRVDPCVVEWLLDALGDADDQARQIGYDALRGLRDAAPVDPGLIRAFARGGRARAGAARVIVERSEAAVLEPRIGMVFRGLWDEDEAARVATAELLSWIGRPAWPGLMDVLGAREPHVRRLAIGALDRICSDTESGHALPQTNASGLTSLVAMLGDEIDNAKWNAIGILCRIGRPAQDALLAGLVADDVAVRRGVLDALDRVDGLDTAAVRRALEHTRKGDVDEGVRDQAAQCLESDRYAERK